MAIDWNCADKLAAVALVSVGVAIGDPGTIAGGVVGAAGLLGAWKVAKSKFGMESGDHLQRVRKEVLNSCADWARAEGMDEADLKAADHSLAKHLADCIPDLATLAGLARHRDRYPKAAAVFIVLELARRDGLFREEAEQFSALARDFALLVVERALADAMQQEAYAAKLRTAMMVEMMRGLREVQDAIYAADQGSQQRDSELMARIARMEMQLPHIMPSSVLRETIVKELELRPGLADEELANALRGFKSEHNRVVARLAKFEASDQRIGSLKASAEVALASYDHQRVAAIYADMREIIDEGVFEGLRRWTELADAEAEALMLSRDWQAAYSLWSDAAAKMQSFDENEAKDLRVKAAYALYDFGTRYAQSALWAAINLLRMLTKETITPANAELIAKHKNFLGNALQIHSSDLDRLDGITLLEEAVTAYLAALEVRTRDTVPADWAMTTNNLGAALGRLGKEVGGAEGAALLQEAVDALKSALEVRTREGVRLDWAATQHNLGVVFEYQSDCISGAARVGLLNKAVTAYRAALEVRTRDTVPADWAMTTNNLGAALGRLGKEVGGAEGAALLQEAVDALNTVLAVSNRDEMPVSWAYTQAHIGTALYDCAIQVGGLKGMTLLYEAVSAYRLALEVWAKEKIPQKSTQIQRKIDMAFGAISGLVSDAKD